MQLKPVKNYKKPIYAATAAVILAAAGMTTGCDVQTAGEAPIVDRTKASTEAETEVMYAGDISIAESEPNETSVTETECVTTCTTEVVTEPGLDGDVVLETRESAAFPGFAPIEESQ